MTRRSKALRALSFHATTDTSEDIMALATISHQLPHLQQLSIQLPRAWELMESFLITGKWPPAVQAQTKAIQACLQVFSGAPRLRVLITNEVFAPCFSSFAALRHLILEPWSPEADLRALHGLTSLETLRINAGYHSQWAVDLRPLASLKQFSVAGKPAINRLPSDLQLPASCQFNLALLGIDKGTLPFGPALSQWLTRLDAALGTDIGNGSAPALFVQDLRLEHLTLRFRDVGNDVSPFILSGNTCPLITQAKNVTFVARRCHFYITPCTDLGWQKVHTFALDSLYMFHDRPEQFLSGRAIAFFAFCVYSNLWDDFHVWHPIAEKLGHSAWRGRSRRKDRGMYAICFLAKGEDDMRIELAPCICQACMPCLMRNGKLQ